MTTRKTKNKNHINVYVFVGIRLGKLLADTMKEFGLPELVAKRYIRKVTEKTMER